MRRRDGHVSTDFLFPQMQVGDGTTHGWWPTFIDYLFVAFNASSAFSPTDTLILSHRAKVLMMVQSLIAYRDRRGHRGPRDQYAPLRAGRARPPQAAAGRLVARTSASAAATPRVHAWPWPGRTKPASRPSSRASEARAWTGSAVNGEICGPSMPVVTA